MSGPNGNGQQHPQVPVGPVPLTLTVTQVTGPSGQLVVLQVSSPMGTQVLFLDPDCAIATGQNLRQAGKAAKTGLVIPAGPFPPGEGVAP